MEQDEDVSTTIKVIAPNKIKNVEVTCAYHSKIFNHYNETVTFNIEGTLFVKDLRRTIQNFKKKELVAIVKESNDEHLGVDHDEQMICDVTETNAESNGVLRVTAYKFLNIKFHEKNSESDTNTESKNEVYVVKKDSETVKMMLDIFNARESKRYKLHPTMNHSSSETQKKITRNTLLVSLESGSTIHIKDEERVCVIN